MSHDLSKALIAAATFLYLERSCPGGLATTAARIYPHAMDAVVNLMAQSLPESASQQERRKFLNDLDEQGSDFLRPINMSEPDLRKMTAEERLDHANKRARGAR